MMVRFSDLRGFFGAALRGGFSPYSLFLLGHDFSDFF